MLLSDIYQRTTAYVNEKGFSNSISVTQTTNCIRIGDTATGGSQFHIELTQDNGAKFRYALSIYLHEFDKVIRSRYKGNDDFADGKWLEYTHITWGDSSPSVRISFVRAEPPDADDGIWKDCVFDLLDACIEEYVRSEHAKPHGALTASLGCIDRRLAMLLPELQNSHHTMI